MNEAAIKLTAFERVVMWRKRWLALQDRVALALLVSGLLAAALILLSRLQVVRIHWTLIVVAVVAVVSAFVWHWQRTRATDKEAAFLIDRTFELEDRITTAHQLLAQGGPQREVETALIDDAASRLADKKAATVAPYRLRAWHVVALIGIAAFTVSVMVPTKQLPGGEAIVAAQSDIQTAGQQLEQVGEEIAKAAPAESETAKLAKEQSELGRAFRMSPESRAEALKQLSALEERIRKRHDELTATHADEIVSAAEKRIRNAIEPARKEKGEQNQANETAQADDPSLRDENQSANTSDASKSAHSKNQRQNRSKEVANQAAIASTTDANSNVKAEGHKPDASAIKSQTTAANPQSQAATKGERQPKQPKTPSRQQQPKADQVAANQPPKPEGNQPSNGQPQSDSSKGQQPNQAQKPNSGQPSADTNAQNPTASPQSGNSQVAKEATPKADGQQGSEPNPQGDQQKTDTGKDTANPLTSLAADQAGKMLPQLSQELLKKAAELRDGKLSPEDINRLRQSAEMLARDLPKIAQSKELQDAVEQLAKQITPEQLEQFARALGNQEQLKRELQASARLMMENQQAKSMVAGMAQNLAKWGEQSGLANRNEIRNRQPNDEANQHLGNGRGGRGAPIAEDERAGREIMHAAGGLTAKSDGSRQRTGQGRDTQLSGNPQRGAGGEFLYLKSPAGKGVSRAPYTSAYPQYRREAERSVERSQVPTRLRSVVKSYFDAINPDAAKKQ